MIIHNYDIQSETNNNRKLGTLFFCLGAFLTVFLLSSLKGMTHVFLNPVTNSYAILCCIFILYIQFHVYKKNQAENEKEIMEQLLRKEAKEQALSKDSMDALNAKYHDMKKQVQMLETEENAGNQKVYTDNLKKDLEYFRKVVKTGNASLDVVLTDKNYICDGSGIKLYYVIEKDAINFMSSEDIYSLFNNMIDNAIEAVKKENPSDRVIKIKAYRKGQMIAISCENYTSVKPHFSEGLPLTSKDDRVTHGFGTLSIRRVAEKYAGNVIFKVENNIFLVSIMLSAPASGIEPAPAETQK